MGGGPESRCVGRVYGADGFVRLSRTAPSKLYTRPTQRLSGPPPIYKLGAENHMLQLLTSSTPNVGRMSPKYVELRKLQ